MRKFVGLNDEDEFENPHDGKDYESEPILIGVEENWSPDEV